MIIACWPARQQPCKPNELDLSQCNTGKRSLGPDLKLLVIVAAKVGCKLQDQAPLEATLLCLLGPIICMK